jgi:hypothetical protein
MKGKDAIEMRNEQNIYSGVTEEDIKRVISAEKGYREEERKKMTAGQLKKHGTGV